MQSATQTEQPHPMLPRSETILPDTKVRETSRFAFFAGDHIPLPEKYAYPMRFMGGVELDMFLTLKETGKELYARPDLYNTGSFMFRCAITQLKTFYLPVNPNMVPPADRDPDAGKLVPGYMKENGRRNHATGQYEDVVVSGQLYRPFYPGDEIDALTRQSTGLRPGGIVEISALAGKTWAEQIAAQLHYFPNWEQIQTAQDAFPRTLKELRDGINAKMSGTTPEMASIGRDMLRSCDEFRLWGLRYLKAWRQIVKFADSQIDSPIAGYNDLCELLFDLLQVNREDTLGQQRDETGAIDKLANLLFAKLQPGEQMPSDPMEGSAAVDATPGVVIPPTPVAENPASNEVAKDATPNYIRVVEATPEELMKATLTAAQAEPLRVGQKVVVMADGREGLVSWKGPNDKIKLAFEDGSSETFDKSEVLA